MSKSASLSSLLPMSVLVVPANRRWRAAAVLALSFVLLLTYAAHTQTLPPAPVEVCDPDPPSDWEKLYKWEDELPQHDVNLPFPEGKTGRYVFFSSQVQQLGWNNHLNEVLLNTHLAYKSNRSYVFQDYIWKPDYYPWEHHPKKPELPRTPINALLSGPPAGGSWPEGDPAPRAISQRFFDTVCPVDERRIVTTRIFKPYLNDKPGIFLFNTWKDWLLDAPERCIEIQAPPREIDNFGQVFDLWFWGTDRVLGLWEEFKNSPVSQLLRPSFIVEAAVARNGYLFQPRGRAPPAGASHNPWERTLAVHIRRGDFEEACVRLATYNSTFYSWNLMPELPDKFANPVDFSWETDEARTRELFIPRCYPTEELILKKIRKSRDDYVRAAKRGQVRYVDTVYILTNAKADWLKRFKTMLIKDGWNNVVTTRDLELDQQQKDVGMVVDMDLARRAAVFIGNGWSSFTSNIVHQRLVDGKEAISIRFF